MSDLKDAVKKAGLQSLPDMGADLAADCDACALMCAGTCLNGCQSGCVMTCHNGSTWGE